MNLARWGLLASRSEWRHFLSGPIQKGPRVHWRFCANRESITATSAFIGFYGLILQEWNRAEFTVTGRGVSKGMRI